MTREEDYSPLEVQQGAEGDAEEAREENKWSDRFAAKMGLLSDKIGWSADTNGFVTLTIIQFMDNWAHGDDCGKMLRAGYSVFTAVFLHMLVLFVQVVITGFLLLSSERMEEDLESDYFHKYYNVGVHEAGLQLRQAIEDGKPLTEMTSTMLACDKGPGNHYLCRCAAQLQVQLPVFYYIMIGIWVCFMMSEIKTSIWWMIHFSGVKRATVGESLFEAKQDQPDDFKQITIVRLRPRTKILLIIVDPLFRMCIAIVLTYAGAKFLILQVRTAKVVLKVLCMRFVINVDEFLFKTLVTKASTKEVSSAKLLTRYGRPARTTWWENGLGVTIYILACVAVIYLIFDVAFYQLTFFRTSCRMYRGAFPGMHGLPRRKDLVEIISEIFE